jgi:4-hydroxythreonine-4-phosphate dehydrogenase
LQKPTRIAITPGEPAGIGPDLTLALGRIPQPAELVVVADPSLISDRAKQLGLTISLQEANLNRAPQPHRGGSLSMLPVRLSDRVRCGHLNPANASYVLETLERATVGCLESSFDAMVTGPVHKGVINDAGFAFTGHTEFIAERTGGDPVMLLTANGFRVALATTHLPLARVSETITAERLTKIIRVLDRDLHQRFRVATPRILVCGLNPHAGECGHLGTEEVRIIAPTLERLRTEGLRLIGPLPADTAFTKEHLAEADVVLAMYHDQGLPTLKHVAFGRAVNVTLGLPIIRTSVDHGTALPLAGSGQADATSLLAALELAIELAS